MRRGRQLGAALLLAAAVGTLGVAQPPGAGDSEGLPLNLDQEAASAPGLSPGAHLFRALLSLALVVCLIYAVYYALRWWRGGLPRGGQGRRILLLDHARLDGDKSVYVVALGKKVVVLGASGSGLRMLCELSGEEAAAFQQASTPEAGGRDAAEDGT